MVSGGYTGAYSVQVILFNWITLQECPMPNLPYETAGKPKRFKMDVELLDS
jgi:hypothetical protein